MNNDVVQNIKLNSESRFLTMTEHHMNSWDGTELFYRVWQGDNIARRAVILFHGGHEHSGRFQDLIDRLDLEGVSIFAWDARGHGRSPGIRGYAGHFQDFVRDADAFITHISKAYEIPTTDMVMLGHSVGSVIISTWLLDYARPVRGAIISSPAFQVKLYFPFALPLLKLLQRIRPDAFVNSYVKPGFLTHDKQEADSRRNDELISPRISVRVLTSLFDTAKRVIKGAHAITTPMLIFSAGSDWVVHRSAHESFYTRLGSRYKALQFFPGFFHEILHEQERDTPILQARQFIRAVFANDPSIMGTTPFASRKEEEYAELCRPLSVINPRFWFYACLKAGLRTCGQLSDGVRDALSAGFDAGRTLNYIYENKARGRLIIGRLIDRLYLNCLGWRLIRQRGRHLQYLLGKLIGQIRQGGRGVHILDVAAGHGHYVLKTLAQRMDPSVTAVCRDIEEKELSKGTQLARDTGLETVHYEKGDAFNPDSLARLPKAPDIIIVSGLYELYSDNRLLQRSLAAIYKALNDTGYLVFTNQPHHPQLELIARTLVNREHKPWVMRLRSQTEIYTLVRQAGFKVEEMLIDDHGVFTVSVARKVPLQEINHAGLTLTRVAS